MNRQTTNVYSAQLLAVSTPSELANLSQMKKVILIYLLNIIFFMFFLVLVVIHKMFYSKDFFRKGLLFFNIILFMASNMRRPHYRHEETDKIIINLSK